MNLIEAERFRTRYGPWAVVAGASQGLGAEFATQLAALGMNIVLIARSNDKLLALSENLKAQYQISMRVISMDLAEPDAAGVVSERTQDIDVRLLIYNAGYSVIGPFLAQPLEDHLRELNTNCRSPLMFAYIFGRRFQARRRGGIVLMSSLTASQGSPLISNYGATKAYNQVLAEGLWDELRGAGIDVLACCAGAISTPNYLNSLTNSAHNSPAPAMSPDAVVRETLDALGRQPAIIPGRTNRVLAFLMQRVLSRRQAITIMGLTLRRMYSTAGEK